MGIGESIKGAVKEKVGKFAEDDELRTEGKAQQRKGEHLERETEERTQAKVHDDRVDELRRRQDALREG